MKLIIGLGNPGEKYTNTRHNAGFLAVDFFLKDKNPTSCQSKFSAQICELFFGTQKVLFVKPQTFMNNSGMAVKEISDFYKTNPQTDILIIHDEVDLPFGEIRLAENSSAAGHNGVQNIIDQLNTQNFKRLRIGIETRQTRQQLPTETFVLQNFTDEEMKKNQEDIFPKIKTLIENFIISNN